MLNCVLFFGRVVLLLASREARVGRCVSDCLVDIKRFGSGWVAVKCCLFLQMRCVAAWVAGGSFSLQANKLLGYY